MTDTLGNLATARVQAGSVAPGLTSINQSLVGGSGSDPFKDATETFPGDLYVHGNWIEFKAMPTKGAAEGYLPDFLRRIISGQGIGTIGGTIRLPLPANLSTDYNPTYSTPDLGMAAGSVLKPFDRAIYGNNDIPGQAEAGAALAGVGLTGIGAALGGTAAAKAAGTALGAMGVTGAAGDAALKVFGGIATNPHKIVLFTGVDFRDHTFSWKLSPRNRRESDTLRRIVEMFAYYAHPEFVAGGLFFKYPEFFQIKFARDSYLFRMRPSVCTDIKVDYHSQGTPAYIRNRDGSGEPAPAEVSLSITFKETEIISKQYLNPSLPVVPAPVERLPGALRQDQSITPPNLAAQIQPNATEMQMPIVRQLPTGGRNPVAGSDGPVPPGGGNAEVPLQARRRLNRFGT
jgi:hypothetical protein